MTAGVLSVIRDWTGVEVSGCPWRAFYDPFVQRVLDAYTWFDKGQLSSFAPQPSARLVQGLGFYHRTLERLRAKRMEQDREQSERRQAAQGAQRGAVKVLRG